MIKKKIAILGSTGSIGRQTLDVVFEHKSMFEVVVLTANNNSSLLIKQAIKFKPSYVVIVNEKKYTEVKSALKNEAINVLSGANALVEVVKIPEVELVLTALVGYSGLLPTISAIKSKKTIALANKETLVVAGELICSLCKEHNVPIIPVDSEHSAIFQCLNGEESLAVEKIYLTASGGPFRGFSKKQLTHVSKEDALKHPNWDMGKKISIDSATLMNKGLEVIEAKWLFNINPDQISVVVHPQSVIHSAVQFIDSSVIAQMGIPCMKTPIQYALGFPNRIKNSFARFSFFDFPNLTFEKPNLETFKNLELSFLALKQGGNVPCILNAANEVAVEAFLKEQISFLNMPELIANCMQKITFVKSPSLDDYIQTNNETRKFAKSLI